MALCARLARCIMPAAAAVLLPPLGLAAQEQPDSASSIAAMQIGEPEPGDAAAPAAGKAYLDDDRTAAPARHPTMMQTASEQMARAASITPASQISSRNQSGAGVAQLSQADLEATLGQLSAVERKVLLQAIEGTDICDNPPDVPAILTLCTNRLENLAGDVADAGEQGLSAEDRLLRGDLEYAVLPSVGQVIERLARGNAATNDLSNQAIASIALAPPPAQTGEEEDADKTGVSEEAQSLINSLINQLTGGTP